MRKILLLIVFLLVYIRPISAQGSTINLFPFQPVTGTLDASTTIQVWRFEGQAGQVMSLLASPTRGSTLNPMLVLLDPTGEIMAQNDDSRFGATEARLEAVTLPDDGIYLVRVIRQGNTAGEYQLTLLEGYGSTPIAYNTDDSRLWLNRTNPTGQIMLGTVPASQFYLRSNLQLTNVGSASYKLTWQFGSGWTLTWNSTGHWEILAGNEVVASGAYDTLTAFDLQLEVLFRNQALTMLINGEEAIRELALMPAEGDDQMLAISFETDAADHATPSLIIDELLISAIYYAEDSLALPPVPAAERLDSYESIPSVILDELVEKGIIDDNRGGVQALVTEGFVFTDELGFSAYPLFGERQFDDFVVGFVGVLTEGTEGTACGLLFRQADSENFGSALFTPQRDLFFLNYEDGELSEASLATRTPALLGGIRANNRFVLVAVDDTAYLYVNGLLQGSIPLTTEAGGLFVQMVLDAEEDAYCLLKEMWVWELP